MDLLGGSPTPKPKMLRLSGKTSHSQTKGGMSLQQPVQTYPLKVDSFCPRHQHAGGARREGRLGNKKERPLMLAASITIPFPFFSKVLDVVLFFDFLLFIFLFFKPPYPMALVPSDFFQSFSDQESRLQDGCPVKT